MNRIVIYHDSCPDGFCAAWVVALASPEDELVETRFVPARYGDPLPDGIDGAEVIVLDFSYPPELTYELRRRASVFWMFDHHRTAEEGHRKLVEALPSGIIFDQSRSGAMLAWDNFVGTGPDDRDNPLWGARWVVAYVQDRDLWKWELPDSRAVSAAIGALPMRGPEDFAAWRDFAERGVSQAVHAGKQILAANERYVEKMVARAGRGHLQWDADTFVPIRSVPIINTTHLVSEVLEKLAVGHDFAVGWFQTADGIYHYSLRSTPEGSDVSQVAKMFCGGGHPQAAGFESGSSCHELVKP